MRPLSRKSPAVVLMRSMFVPVAMLALLPLLAGLLVVAWLLGMALLCLLRPFLWVWRQVPGRSPTRRLMFLVVASLSLWLLSACGTARSPVLMCPPVPADLMEPPSQPVLLKPA